MKLQFNEAEIQLILSALDFYSRLFMGQYDHMVSELRWNNYSFFSPIEKDVSFLLYRIRGIIFPELQYIGFNGSHGIYNTNIDYRAGVAYNMEQEIRYKMAYFKHPEGGDTVDFKTPLEVESDPYPWPQAECLKINDEIY